VDVLVNNAGTILRAAAEEVTLEDWEQVIQVNLTSVFQLSQLAARVMIPRGGAVGKSVGKIVNIASLLSFQGGIRVPAYAASKGGVAQLTKALANEWAPKGIQVNAIAPGYFATTNTEAMGAAGGPDGSSAVFEFGGERLCDRNGGYGGRRVDGAVGQLPVAG
jgi:2-deoxy-D-gluconate 3-dehydrogenase